MANATSFDAQILEAWSAFDRYQTNFEHSDVAGWMREHTEVPIFLAALYVAFVFGGQQFMKDRRPLNLRPVVIVWNLLLAVFSNMGAFYILPALVEHARTAGFHGTLCDGCKWYVNGKTGTWMMLFILSKIPELVDTVLLVFQKKPVILLHWYHHTTVMLYCWHSYINTIAPGMWYCGMNYFVHAIMYSYYFMMSLSGPTRKMVKPFAPLITFLQIAQMVVGLVVSVSAAFAGPGCTYNHANNVMCIAMYASYFVLFGKLFVDSYIKGGRRKKEAARAKKTA